MTHPLPQNWQLEPLSTVTPIGKKYGIVDGPFGSNLKTIHYKTEGIPIITSGYVTDGIFHANDYLYVTEEKFQQEKRSAVHGGDIVMAKIGARCGASAILPEDHETGILSGNALKITVDQSRHNTYFIWYSLWRLHCSGKLDAIKGVGAQPAISMANLKKYKIPLPPLPEQHRIVAVLETWDKAIEKLEQKIELKKNVKKGLMQKLLTGKVRLPGFTEEWERVKIGDVLDYEQPQPYIVESTDYSDEYQTPVLTANKAFILGYTNETSGICENVPAIIFDDFTTDSKYVSFPFKVKSSAIKILRCKDSTANLRFIYEKMKLIDFAVGEHKRNYISAYQHLDISVPQAKEQNAIADVVSISDSEIEALGKKLSLLKGQKTYLLNHLITGRIRTPENMQISTS